MKALRSDIVNIVKNASRGRPLRVGLFLRSNIGLAVDLSEMPLRTVVVGDHFSPLFRFQRRSPRSAGRVATVEARLGALPIAAGSLDVVILSRGMPSPAAPSTTLEELRALLVDGGLLIWPHPITDGGLGSAGRIASPFRPGVTRALARSELCSLTMAAGFKEVGQIVSRGRGIFPWAVTTGIAARGWTRDFSGGVPAERSLL